jgi:hypothetical protein
MGVFIRFATAALAAVTVPVLADPPGLIHAMDQAATKHHGKAMPATSSSAAAPVQGDAPGVTRRLEDANAHSLDADGHKLDAAGHPVGQAPVGTEPLPAPASTGQ